MQTTFDVLGYCVNKRELNKARYLLEYEIGVEPEAKPAEITEIIEIIAECKNCTF